MDTAISLFSSLRQCRDKIFIALNYYMITHLARNRLLLEKTISQRKSNCQKQPAKENQIANVSE